MTSSRRTFPTAATTAAPGADGRLLPGSGGLGALLLGRLGPGALLGGLVIGVVESLCGLYLGESLGQIGIFTVFILVVLFRPMGLFGARA